MREKAEYCFNCENYIIYYEKFLYGFSRSGQGFCKVKNAIVEQLCRCGQFLERVDLPPDKKDFDCALSNAGQIAEILKKLK